MRHLEFWKTRLDSYLLEVPGGVDAGLDLALFVQIQDGVHGLADQVRLSVQVSQVETTHRLVALDQTECMDGELVVPVLGHSDQVLLLARQHVGRTWKTIHSSSFIESHFATKVKPKQCLSKPP